MSERSTVLDEAFDVDTEQGTPAFSLVPPGKYAAEIEDASISPTKNGAGQLIGLRWRIVEGEYENRAVFSSILIQHTNPDAQRFGRQMFRDICFACGITGKVSDLEVLKFKKVSIRVGIEKDKSGVYSDKNKVARVEPYVSPWNGQKPAASAAPSSPMPKPGAAKQLDDEIPF
jgi:hypothetical protein